MIFISYAAADARDAESLERHLEDVGMRTWRDASRFPVGERFVHEISKAMREARFLVVLLTQRAVQSYWVDREMRFGHRLRAVGSICRIVALGDGTVDVPAGWHVDEVVGDSAGLVSLLGGLGLDAPTAADDHVVEMDAGYAAPDPSTWLGFSNELELLDQHYCQGQPGAWVSGLGGSGKSALAATWLRSVADMGFEKPLRIHALRWDFYQDASLDSFLAFVTSVEARWRPGSIAVLDGFERCSNTDQGRALESCRSRFVVVTSRQAPPQDYSPFIQIHLAGMTLRDISTMLDRYGFLANEAEDLARLVDGHPLSLSLAAGLIKAGQFSPADLLVRLRHESEKAS